MRTRRIVSLARIATAPIRRRLSYANVMATVAVFIAVGGGAYAATQLPKNSVGSKQLKKGAVTPSKVAPRTLRRFKGQKGDRGPAGRDGAPATALWALVDRDGNLVAGSGATSQPLGMGLTYQVTFSRDVSRCAVVGTARPDSANDFVVVEPESGDPKIADVEIANPNGGITIAAFSLAAFC